MPIPARSRIAAALLLVLLSASPALAQGTACQDGFTGPCCASVAPNIPPLPAFTWTDARQTCWIDCGPFPSSFGTLTLTAPTPTGACAVYDAMLIGPMVGCPAPLGSRLRLYYTRNWTQAFPGSGMMRVYRFVAVGNVCLAPTPGFSCAVEGPPATPFVFGFVDYAFQQVGPPPCPLTFRAAALAIGHPCDRFVHDPACPFTASPSPSHPLDQWTLVAPGLNFTPNGNLVPPSGPLSNVPREGIRQVQVNAAGTCTATERFNSLTMTNVLRQCACVSPTLTTQGPFWRQSLVSTTSCGSTLDSTPLCPFQFTPPPMVSPFPTLVAWSVGSWGPGPFPGLPGGNRVFLAQGSATFTSSGTAVCPPLPSQRAAYYGAETRWGFGPAGQRRVDLVDNVQLAGGSVVPVVGGPAPRGTQVVFFY